MTDEDLIREGKQTHDLRHCDDPGCTTGTLIGKCRRCGFRVVAGTECPATMNIVFAKTVPWGPPDLR